MLVGNFKGTANWQLAPKKEWNDPEFTRNLLLAKNRSIKGIPQVIHKLFCKYGGHFVFCCFERHYGMLMGQISVYLPPGHPIIAI